MFCLKIFKLTFKQRLHLEKTVDETVEVDFLSLYALLVELVKVKISFLWTWL